MTTYRIQTQWHEGSSKDTGILISPQGHAQMRAKGYVETSTDYLFVLPVKSRGKYRKDGTCPYCGSTRIDPVDYDDYGNTITGCGRCCSEWDERDAHTIHPHRAEAIMFAQDMLDNGCPVESLTASERKLLRV